MPPRHAHLFDRLASVPALHAAAKRAVRGKRRKPGAAAFMAGLEVELLQLERELKSGAYRTGQYLAFEVHDPKHRVVSAAPFRDRVVHHALYEVVGPIFERGFVHDSYANRVGKGTHRAVVRYEHFRHRYRYVLRCDIHRYFPAIDQVPARSWMCASPGSSRSARCPTRITCRSARSPAARPSCRRTGSWS
jgi:hypothetical protein